MTSANMTARTQILAMACLLCEVANADHKTDEAETQAKNTLLARLLDTSSEEAAELIARAQAKAVNPHRSTNLPLS